jgi:hypothetical protein
MTETCDPNRADFACGAKALFIWWIPTAILASTAFSNSPFLVVIWPVLLAFMGGACLVNARRCGRRHCYVTGPFFLALAAVSLLYGLGVLNFGRQGWRDLAAVLLVGSCALTCLPEWIWGKYLTNPSHHSLEERS